MNAVNMLEAKTNLSRLVDRIERGLEGEIVIARNGRPVARLVPVVRGHAGQRIGLLKGRFQAPSLEQLDEANMDITHGFQGSD